MNRVEPTAAAAAAAGLTLGLGIGATVAKLCAGQATAAAASAEEKTPFHPGFPPQQLLDAGNVAVVGEWFDANAPTFSQMDGATERERALYAMTAADYVKARVGGDVTCLEYCAALVKRMLHYKDSNAFMKSSYELTDVILQQAAELDAKADKAGVESIAPLYGLPVPIKGTAATKDFPSSAGTGVLDSCMGVDDCGFAAKLKAAGAVLMGKTNVPEFAASWITLNRTNGTVWNPFPCADGALTTGGSSGGAAFAVTARIAPIAMTEDTGGSTRHPAHQCGNFGYDPPRNKYPNDGNPGITYFNDQVGVNARTFEDVLLFDKAVNGLLAEHDLAAAAAASIDPNAIVVGFPTEIFVELNPPAAVLQRGGGCTTPLRASVEILSKLTRAEAVLAEAGFSISKNEWPRVPSTIASEGQLINALYDHIYCGEFAQANDGTKQYTGANATILGSHSFTGQMATFCADWLENCDVSINQIRRDVTPVGYHNPAGLMASFTSESEFRMLGLHQRRGAEAWNLYFDTHRVDMIITPSQFADSATYSMWVQGKVPILKKTAEGEFKNAHGSPEDANQLHYCCFKHFSVPKLTVPLGLDSSGRPTSCTIWGRAVPPEKLYDDVYAKTFDLEWLYKVQRVVNSLHALPDLRRMEPPINGNVPLT
eukprot:SAG31_NODE_1311_length_8869_cov_10.603535_1_plen_654_part_00